MDMNIPAPVTKIDSVNSLKEATDILMISIRMISILNDF